MTDRTPDPNDRPFSEDQLKRILRRALELDQHQPQGLTEREVREIAAELEITDAAISQALTEAKSTQLALPESALLPRWLRHWRAAATGFLVGLPPGLFAGLITREGLTGRAGWLAILTVYGSAAFFAFRESGQQKHLKYQLRNAGLWLGLATGIARFVGPFPDLVMITTIWAASTSVAGATVLWLRDVWQQRRSFLRRLQPAREGFESAPNNANGAARIPILWLGAV